MIEITFDKSATKFITEALGTLRGRNCFYCGIALNQRNFAGAVKKDKAQFFCDNLCCLLGFTHDREN